MFREQHNEYGNRYDTHINMYPPESGAEPLRKTHIVHNTRPKEPLAPYPIDDTNEIINDVPMFTSPASHIKRTFNSNSASDSGSEYGSSEERYEAPFQFPRNSDSSHSLVSSYREQSVNFKSAEDLKDPSAQVKDASSARISQPPPPPYEESEVKILQEKIYRSRGTTAETVPPPSNKTGKAVDLSQYSGSALEFRKVYDKTVADSSKFTPEIQFKWCETLLEYSFNDEFLSRYNINAEKLKRELKPEEKIKNQKVILEHSFKVLTKLISLKYGPAMYLMGTLYSHQPYLKIKNKNIVVRNDKKALEYYCRASKCNHSDACYRAGVCYEFQRGVTPDQISRLQSLQRAFFYYERGAQVCNNYSCMYKLGMLSLYGDDPAIISPMKALEWFKKAARSGESPQSLYELGKVYEFTCLPRHIQALLQQSNVKKCTSKALKYYYECAMNANYPIAQWKLGHCYEFGELQLPIIAKKSIAWYAKASMAEPKGNAMAMLSLSGWYLTGASGVLQPNDSEAFKWAEKSCQVSEGKFSRAEYALGYYYENAIGCEKDITRALEHYRRAARLGHPKAIERLESL